MYIHRQLYITLKQQAMNGTSVRPRPYSVLLILLRPPWQRYPDLPFLEHRHDVKRQRLDARFIGINLLDTPSIA